MGHHRLRHARFRASVPDRVAPLAKARFILDATLKAGKEDDLLAAYDALAGRVAEGVPGHISHQLCQGLDAPDRWTITSEWEDTESARAWLSSEDHHALIGQLRDLWAGAEPLTYEVRVETRH